MRGVALVNETTDRCVTLRLRAETASDELILSELFALISAGRSDWCLMVKRHKIVCWTPVDAEKELT